MARIRSLKPEFWDDRKLARLVSRDARMLYMGLWNHSDEHARCNGDPHWVKGRIFPYDDDLTDDGVAELLAELVKAERVVAYEIDGDPYLWLPKLGQHQRLDPKVDSRLPQPPDDPPGAHQSAPPPDDAPPAPHEPAHRADLSAQDPDSSAPGTDEYGSDPDNSAPHARAHCLLPVAGSREPVAGVDARARARPTRIPDDFALTDEMRSWARTKGILGNLTRETERFRDYWLGAGKTKADWPATWRNWVSREADDTRNQTVRRSISSVHAEPDRLPTEDERVAAWNAEKRRSAGDAARASPEFGDLLRPVAPAYGGGP